MYRPAQTIRPSVALLAEGVDRNDILWAEISKWLRVALLAEGVDRNTRSGWNTVCVLPVALLAEGVDRNQTDELGLSALCVSPSSRRAWIEIR